MLQTDRRQHERRSFEQDVLCYIDGNRLDGRTADISVSGLFLYTRHFQNFPVGAIVALVFEDVGVPPGTAFMFARVMRHQAEPDPGVGLLWQKAVCAASSLPLKRVLKRLFGFVDPVVTSKELPDRGLVQFVFHFPGCPAPDGTPAASAPLELDRPEPSGSGAVRQGGTVSRDAPRREAVASNPAVSSPASAGRRGPVTSQIDSRKSRQTVDIQGVLEGAGIPVAVKIAWLGLGAVGVESPWSPADPDMPMLLRFQIPTREGSVDLRCNTRLKSVDIGKAGRPTSLELMVKDVDEGGQPGLLVRYLKWLALRQMAKD